MRLMGYLGEGQRRIGAVEENDLFDLGTVDEFYADPPSALAQILGPPRNVNSVTAIPFVPTTARVFCVGVNYLDHGAEAKAAGVQSPSLPTIFGRWPSTLVVDGDVVPVPPKEPGLDWECELAAVIGTATWNATEEEALTHVLGYTALNDLSARRKQFETTRVTLGKNADKSAPIGPVLVTPDEIADPTNLRQTTRVNGELVQDGNTGDMLFNVANVISYISDTITLLPGDVIAMGTPSGVGAAMKPPRFLQPGDIVEIEIESIGALRNKIVTHD